MGSCIRLGSALCAAAVVAMLGVAAVPVAAQTTGTIRGQVTDASTQRPLSGAQVSILDGNRSAVTDANGGYTLNAVPAGTVTVVAATLGYSPSRRSVTVVAGQTATANFALGASAIGLETLVVTGTPGATQKREIGNAVTTIAAAEITEKAPIRNVTELLQARTPGLTLMQGSGAVGTNANIRIRGAGSLNAGVRPVFYIDGVRIASGSVTEYGVGGQATSALDAINPEDIESIEVIKGPAASTLYGADAAAGVIQIITKKGKTGQQSMQWSFKGDFGQSDWHLRTPTNYTTCTTARVGAPAAWPGCAGQPVGTVLTQNPLEENDPKALRTADLQSYTGTLRGGGERFSFYIGADREDEQGVFYNNYYWRNAGRGNFFVTPRDNFDVTLNLSYTVSEVELPLGDNASNGLLRNAYRGLPGVAVVFADGYRTLGPNESNAYDQPTRSRRFIAGTTLNYQPFSWFRNRLTVGLDQNYRRNINFFPIDLTGRAPYGNTVAAGAVYVLTPQARNYTLDYAGTITKDFGESLTSDFSFGTQMLTATAEYLSADGEGLVTNQARLISNAAVTRGYESFSEQTQLGFFVQEQLGWQNRLFVTGAVRLDDNSAFGENFSTVIYPRASASWVISEEPFFNVPNVDEFRLRTAWGRAGNSPSPFSADQTFGAGVLTLDNGASVPTVFTSAYGNPDLTAETGQEFEIGFETSLFGDRANLDFTYYNKHTYDALISVPVAPSSGFTGSRLINMGEIANSGIEAMLSLTPIQRRGLTWEMQFGASTNANELVSQGTREESVDFGSFATVQRHIVGYPLGGYWATDVERNADGTVKRSTANPAVGVASTDTFFVGSSVPTRELSLANTFTLFRNLRLYAFADYKGGHYLWSAQEFVRCRTDLNCQKVNDPTVSADEVAILRSGATAPYISRADFVKLRELSATYTLPSGMVRRLGAEQASFTFAGRNLAVWSKYKFGPDPELNFSGDATFSRTDYMSTPMIRRWVATVNLTF